MPSYAGFDGPQTQVTAADGLLLSAAASVIFVAVALGAVRYVGGGPMERGPEGVLASGAFAAVLAAPGMLMLLARADRPVLLLAAASALLPLSFVSLAGATLPLLIPAGMALVAYGRRSASLRSRARVPGPVTVAIVVVLVIAAGAALLLHEDPRSYSTPTGAGSTSNIITFGESILALGFVATALATGWHLTAPRR